MNGSSIAARLIPVLLLLALGQLLGRRRVLTVERVAGLKELVVRVTLPCVLFVAFASARLEARHLALVGAVFGACAVALAAGAAARRILSLPVSSPFLLTGFEAGMLGYALFTALHGASEVPRFAIADLGQVLFVFFVLVPALERTGTGAAPGLLRTVRGFIATPVVIAILAGLAVQGLGVRAALASWSLGAGLFEAVAMLGGLTMPLVALVVGHDLRLDPRRLRRPLLTVAARAAVWVPLAFLLVEGIARRLLGMDGRDRAALALLLTLPPPFVVPIFLRGAAERDREYVADTLAVSTVLTLVVVPVVAAAVGP